MHTTPTARAVAFAFAAPFCLAAQSTMALEWFPRHPASLDQLYLLERNNCGDSGGQIPADNLVLSVLDADAGVVELRGDSGAQLCGTPPPWDSYVAVPIPAKIGDVTIRQLVVRLTDTGSGVVFEYSMSMPERVGIPPSIAGTWFAPQRAEQGLLFNVSRNAAGGADLAVSFNTYAADGTQRWHAGVAPIDAEDPFVTIELTDTGTGVFGGTATTPDAMRTWGDLDVEYVACGELHVMWSPEAYTGLGLGAGGRMTQLTQSYGDPCDLDSRMEQLGGRLSVLDVAIEPLGAGGQAKAR